MNAFTDDIVTPALLILADWSVRWSIVILGLALLLTWRSLKASAGRYALCRLVLVGGLLLPLLPRCWGQFPWIHATVAKAVETTDLTFASDIPPEEPGAVIAGETESTRFRTRSSTPSHQHRRAASPGTVEPVVHPAARPLETRRVLVLSIASVWLIGFGVQLARLVAGLICLLRLRHAAQSVSAAAWALLEQCRAELGGKRGVDLRLHASVEAPLLIGGRRPLILVPPDHEQLSLSAQRAALLHELIHLNRYDDWAKAGEELVRAVFFFHPLVRWLLQRLEGERETLCDAALVEHGLAPRELARILLDFATRLGAGRTPFALNAALPFFHRLTVKDRIHQLLEDDMTSWSRPLSRRRRVATALAVLGILGVLGTFGVQARAPEEKKAPAAQALVPEKKIPIVSGRVEDETGKAIADAVVVLRRIVSETKPLMTRTAADGRFSFEQLPPGDKPTGWGLQVVAGKDGLAPVAESLRSHNVSDMVLRLPRATTMQGVIKKEDGTPVPGARVHFAVMQRHEAFNSWCYVPDETLRGTPLEALFAARSNEQGIFRLQSAPLDHELVFRVTAEGFADLDNAVRGKPRGPILARADAPALEFTLQPEARIQGLLVSHVPGVKVAGVQILAHGNDTSRKWVRTDAAGRFSFRGLGEERYSLQLPEAGPLPTWTARELPTVTPRSGADTPVQIEIIEGTIVEGVVHVAGTEQPVAGASVGVVGPAHPRGSMYQHPVTTDAEGRYRLRVPPGPNEILVVGAPVGFTPPTTIDAQQPLQVPDGVKTLVGPTLTVVRAAALEGRVVDVRGQPVPHAVIIGICRAGTCVRLGGDKVTTDAQGRFRLSQGPEGAFPIGEATALQVELPGEKVFEVRTIVAEGQVEVRLPTLAGPDVKEQPDVKPNELAGTVVDDQGKPLEGVHVHIWDWVNRPEYQTRTDKDGRFRIKNPDNERRVQVRFRKPGYSPVMFVQQPVGVKNFVVAMDSKTYFEGTVKGPDGKPAANALIRANQGPKQADGVVISTIWTETHSDAAGHYRLYVEPDAYEFLVKAPGIGVARLPKRPIDHGQAKALDITLEPGVTFRAITVDAGTGQPIAGVRLHHWQHKEVEGRSNAKGEVSIGEMLPGRFEFQVDAAGYRRWWSEEALSEWSRFQAENHPGEKWQRNFDDLDFNLSPGMAPVKIVLEKGVRITGRVLDPDGNPVSGATVAPARTGSGNSLTGDTRFSVPTKADGTFDMLLPASNAALYNLVAHDGKYGQWRKWANGVYPPIQTKPGQELRDVTLTLTRPATVRGKVVDAQGKPVAGREVRAHAKDKLENRYYDPTTRTKADGTFELRFIRPGEHYIQAAPFWLAAEEAPDGSTHIATLAAGQVLERIQLIGKDDAR